jgi:hypothetical protein
VTTKFDKAWLLAALKPKTVPSGIKGFSIRQLSVAEVEAIRIAMKAAGNSDSFGLRLVAASVIDSAGASVLSAADIPALQESSNEQIDKLTALALELNGFVKAPDAKN